MGEPPAPITVNDLFDLRPFAVRLDDALGLLRRGQAGLGQILDRLDVPSVSGPGTLTFYPYNAGDVARVAAALEAAAHIRAAVVSCLGPDLEPDSPAAVPANP
jgi:hypothetical protein